MQTHELLIAIPTKNHPKHIMYYLSKTLDDSLENNINIHIFDASDDDETENVVKKRICQGYKNLFYIRYAPDTTLEDRCEHIYVNTGYKYIWLCGDGIVLNIRKNISIVKDEISKGRDLILFGTDSKYVNTYKEYYNSLEFCRECFAQATLFGSVILRGDLIDKELFDYCKKRYFEHAVPGVYYELFKSGEISAVYIKQKFFDANPYKKANIAKKEGRLVYAYAQLFTETLWKIPDEYNDIKKSLEREISRLSHLFRWEHLWSLRIDGNLNLKIYMKYRKYLKIASNTKPIQYFMVSLCPIKLAKKIALIEDDIW